MAGRNDTFATRTTARGCRAERGSPIRNPDNPGDSLIASALAHAQQCGCRAVAILLAERVEPRTIQNLLADSRVATVVLLDGGLEGGLPEDIQRHPRLGRGWTLDRWALPHSPTHAYLVGPRSRLSPDLFRGL